MQTAVEGFMFFLDAGLNPFSLSSLAFLSSFLSGNGSIARRGWRTRAVACDGRLRLPIVQLPPGDAECAPDRKQRHEACVPGEPQLLAEVPGVSDGIALPTQIVLHERLLVDRQASFFEIRPEQL